MAASKVVQMSSYSRRLRDNVKSILDNYGEIMKAAKVTDSLGGLDSQMYHVENEIEVRAVNIVRAAEALSKLVSELKEYVILNDFSTINTTITRRSEELQRRQQQAMEEAQRQYDTYKQCQLLAMKHSSAS